MFKIEKITEKDTEDILNIFDCLFLKKIEDCKECEIVHNIYRGVISWTGFCEYDIKIMCENKIVGFYLFDKNGLENEIKTNEFKKYKNEKGLNGWIMGVIPEFQGKGIGKMLVDYSKKINGFDYIWGGNFKKLNNIDFWIKQGREIVYEDELNYYTIYKF